MKRRKFILAAGFVGAGFVGLRCFTKKNSENENTATQTPSQPISSGYGPLVKDPEGILHLPVGFSYKIISRKGEKMADGLLLPGMPDGMATFASSDERVIVVRNHEISPNNVTAGAFGENYELLNLLKPGDFYDYGKGKMPGLGGTTTFIYNEQTGAIEKQYMSLAGTYRNCAGGRTPWNSWLTCEEDVTTIRDNTEKNHGYVFEVPASPEISLAKPEPIKAMGRFNHEAVCVDPKTGIVYLTEDRGDGLLYRFLPNEKGNLKAGGKLQALALKESPGRDTRNWGENGAPEFPQNQPAAVYWIDLDNVEAPDDDLRIRGFQKGAALFARGEGIWFDKNEFYFACTNGGKIQKGQIFKYTLSADEGTSAETAQPGKLELFVESANPDILKYCDNLTVSPWGDLVLCEDDSHPFLVGVTPEGELYHFAEGAKYQTEFAGVCFSPSGKTMFVNIQGEGLTLAITGPWKQVV